MALAETEPAKQTATTGFDFFRDGTQKLALNEVRSVTAWQRFQTLPSKVLDSAVLFYPDGKGGYEEYKTGDTVPKRFWAVPESLDLAFRIPGNKPVQDLYFYIRIQSVSQISIPIYSLS